MRRRSKTTDEADLPDAGDQDLEPQGESLREVIVTIIVAIAIAVGVQAVLVKPYRIPSGSMENTLRCKDRVLVDRVSYRFGDPKRFDTVVFHPPAAYTRAGNPDPDFVFGLGENNTYEVGKDDQRKLYRANVTYIKRIIGLPGDSVEVKRHRAYVNGKKLKEPFARELEGSGLDGASEFGPYKVPKGTYLMFGDNRENSQDGRFFGAVPRDFVIGKAFMVYWPPARFGGLPEKDPGNIDVTKPDPKCGDLSGVSG